MNMATMRFVTAVLDINCSHRPILFAKIFVPTYCEAIEQQQPIMNHIDTHYDSGAVDEKFFKH